MLKKTLLLAILLISTASHALTRTDGFSLPAGKAAVLHSEPPSLTTADNEFPRHMSLEEYDPASSNLSIFFHGMIARKHRPPAKKSLRVASSPTDRVAREGNWKHKIYRVRKGDTIYSIARKFQVRPDALSSHNNMGSSAALIPGQRLKIPASEKHTADRAQKKDDDDSTPAYSSVRFAWPLRSIFSVHRDESSGVRPLGIIIKGASSSSVACAAKGRVEKIGVMRGYGRYIIIKHESHFLTVYSGLKDIFVKEGDKVRRGEKIGTHEGSLHFQINQGGRPINPLELLPDRRANYSALAR